jgi:hypothetical protein
MRRAKILASSGVRVSARKEKRGSIGSQVVVGAGLGSAMRSPERHGLACAGQLAADFDSFQRAGRIHFGAVFFRYSSVCCTAIYCISINACASTIRGDGYFRDKIFYKKAEHGRSDQDGHEQGER